MIIRGLFYDEIMKRKTKIEIIIIIIFIIGWIISWIPVTETITLDIDKVDGDGFRIVLISDLHSSYYGNNQKDLIKMVDDANPDIVLLAGDIFDDDLKKINAEIATRELADKYDCYYVTGNHEYWSGDVPQIKDYLRGIDITVLEGDCSHININGVPVDICGIDDPTRLDDSTWKAQLDKAYSETNPDSVKILVSHRPERVSVYEQYDFDLIVAGHAHAGQVVIPFINRGLYVPNQGIFAKYINGLYTLSNGSALVVSRGLARESTPLPRFFNNPEIVVIDIM